MRMDAHRHASLLSAENAQCMGCPDCEHLPIAAWHARSIAGGQLVTWRAKTFLCWQWRVRRVEIVSPTTSEALI
eukprot:4777966-Amphidinium_carterae.1